MTIVNRRDEFRASKIMLERARAMENIEFLTPYVVEEFLPGDDGALDRARLRNVETGETRELPMNGAFIAIGHEPQSEIVDGHRRDRRRTATSSPRASPPAPTCRACSPPATSSTTPTARRSPPPAAGCQAALDAEWYLRDNPQVPTPAALEGTGDLAEEQWAPASVAQPTPSARRPRRGARRARWHADARRRTSRVRPPRLRSVIALGARARLRADVPMRRCAARRARALRS